MQNQKTIPISNKTSKSISLEDLLPQSAELELNGRVFTLRPIDLDDQVWLRNKFGDEKLNFIFQNQEMESISQIVYHQLSYEDKLELKAVEINDIDDDGNEIVLKVTGPMLLRKMIKGPIDSLKVVNALLHTIGISQPVLDKLAEQEIKKKEPMKKKTAKKKTKK